MQNQEVYDELIAKFQAKYGQKPQIVAYAPGRIEVLGNHTDYNEGYVFSAAIDKGTFFAVSPSADDTCASSPPPTSWRRRGLPPPPAPPPRR